MKTEIIIPTFNQEDFTIKCMQSIKKYTVDYKIIWVDNGSTTESRQKVLDEITTHSDYLSIWLDKNYGFVKAVNIGIAASKEEFIVLQNNDTEVTSCWLERLMKPMENNSVMITGPLTDTTGSWQGWRQVKQKTLLDLPDLTGLTGDEISELLYKTYGDKTLSVDMVAFFSTLFRKSVFDSQGGLNTAFGVGFADDDYCCHAVKKSGGKIMFVPSAFVYHHHRTTFKSLYSVEEIKQMQNKNLSLYKKMSGVK